MPAGLAAPSLAVLNVTLKGQPFSDELRRQLEGMPSIHRQLSSYEHWIDGVYLITGVTEDERQFSWRVSDSETLDSVRDRLGSSLTMTVRGNKVLRLASAGALEGVEAGHLEGALARLQVPCTLVFEHEGEPNCGDDHITAVNLTRPIQPPQPRLVAEAVDKIAREYPKASPPSVELTHFIGGPCDEHEIVSCIVLGGPTRGWTVVDKLSEAIKLATSRAIRRSPAQGPVSGGQTVRVEGLQARKDLNGELGVALKYVSDTGRWLVRLRNGEGVKIKPDNLAGMDGAHGRVYVFWGDARWSRAQLLGEIARGHWGLCRASVADVSVAVAARRCPGQCYPPARRHSRRRTSKAESGGCSTRVDWRVAGPLSGQAPSPREQVFLLGCFVFAPRPSWSAPLRPASALAVPAGLHTPVWAKLRADDEP